VVPNQKKNTHFCLERGMRTMNWVQLFLCIRESCHQLKGLGWVINRMLYIILRGRWSHYCSGDHPKDKECRLL
jgi:hypothetical protein